MAGQTDEWLDLPSIERFTPRSVSEHYGADRIAAAYCGIAPPYPVAHGLWNHGWVPRFISNDPDIAGEYLKVHELRRGRDDFWLSVRDPQPIFESRGWNAKAIGLPVVYLPERQLPRLPGSLLVMPAHSLEWTTHEWKFSEYADAIDRIRSQFTRVVVCVYPTCLEKGYWADEFKKRGFEIVAGCHWSDANGLIRLQKLLSRFEFVTTNGFGSHLVYAPFFGARVSLFGPFAKVNPEDLKHDTTYLPGNRHVELLLQAQSEESLQRRFPFLFCEPGQAGEHRDWARAEVGYENKVAPDELRRLFRWSDAELRHWRMYGRHLRTLRGCASRLAPEFVKHWLRMAIRPRYRRNQRLERMKLTVSGGSTNRR